MVHPNKSLALLIFSGLLYNFGNWSKNVMLGFIYFTKTIDEPDKFGHNFRMKSSSKFKFDVGFRVKLFSKRFSRFLIEKCLWRWKIFDGFL